MLSYRALATLFKYTGNSRGRWHVRMQAKVVILHQELTEERDLAKKLKVWNHYKFYLALVHYVQVVLVIVGAHYPS